MRGALTVQVMITTIALGCEAPTEGLGRAAAHVAVGAAGTILSSSDGRAWLDESLEVDADLLAVAASPSAVVAVGTHGSILSATDGERWRERSVATNGDLSHVVFTGEKFIAVGGDWDTGALVFVSEDGVDWSAVDAPSSHMFHAIAAGSGWLTAAAYHRSDRQTPALFTASLPSSSPSSWSEGEGPDFYDSVVVGDSVFVAGGTSVASSGDGMIWDVRSLPSPYLTSGIAYDGATLVVVGERGTILSSSDGEVWIQRPVPSGERFLSAVTAGAGFIAVGAGGTILTSVDGETWMIQSSMVSRDLNDVATLSGPL